MELVVSWFLLLLLISQTREQLILTVVMGQMLDPLMMIMVEVADLVVQGIKQNQLYLFPHPELGDAARERMGNIDAAFGEPDPARVQAQQEFLAQLLPKDS